MSKPESPQRIISDRNAFEIYSPAKSIRINVVVAPDYTITTSVEQIKNRREQQLAATAHFTGITRRLIHSMMELDAARLVPGSEDISPEISVIEYQDQFSAAVRGLAGISISDKAVKRLISSQGRLLTGGQDHMGEMSPIVREKVVALSNRVSVIYLEMANRP